MTRKIHLDLLRIIAIFFVVYNHTNEKGYYLFSITENPLTYPFYMALSVLCSIAIPIFFMISGALLLGKEESLRTLFRKRILRILAVILLFSFLQYAYKAVWLGQPFDLLDFLKRTVSSPMIIPYWYLYSYLVYLLLLPFLRRLARAMRGKEYAYFMLLFLVFGGIKPILQFLLGLGDNPYLSIPFQDTLIFYPLMGYYFETQAPQKFLEPKFLALGALLSVACISILCALTWYRGLLTGEITEAGNGLFITSLNMIPVFTVYLGAKSLCGRVTFPALLQKAIVSLGGCVFGIYLLEERFREALMGIDLALAPIIGWMPACFVWILSVLFCCYITVCILKRIPGVKALL